MFDLLIQNYVQILMAAMIVVALSVFFRPLAYKITLVDEPTARKNHQKNTPLIGGVCIFLACAISLLIFDDSWGQDLRSLFVGAALFLALGVTDDQFDIKATVKLLAQLTITYTFIVSTGLEVSNIGKLFGSTDPYELGSLSIPFTICAIVGLTNAFNMMDGCDGLAGSLVGLAVLALLYFGSIQFDYSMQFLLLLLFVTIFVFLFFNFSNNPNFKIFLGDGGSMFLGFVISALLVKFADGNTTRSPSIVLWFVAVPVYDFFAVVAFRLILKRKIMLADRSHLHHYLLSNGRSHFQVTTIILFTAIVLLCLGVFLEANYPSLSLPAFLGLFTVYLSLKFLKHIDC